jgi:SAM-dependent methyltransferase
MVHALNFFNRPGNRRVASALDIRPRHHVLEVGFGGGSAIPTTSAALGGRGRFVGIDLSPDMTRLAAARFERTASEPRLVFACGDAAHLPLVSGTFDRAYAMHSHLYWPSPLDGVREMRRVLRPGGRILLGMDVVSGVRLIRWFGRGYDPADPDRLAPLFQEAGFEALTRLKLSGRVVAVIGTRP